MTTEESKQDAESNDIVDIEQQQHQQDPLHDFINLGEEDAYGMPMPQNIEKWYDCLKKPSANWTCSKRRGNFIFCALCCVLSLAMLPATGCAVKLHMWCAIYFVFAMIEQLSQEAADRMQESTYWDDRR